MNLKSQAIIFLGMIVGGFLIEAFISQFHFLTYRKKFKKYNYKFSRYLFYLFFPLLALLFSLFFTGTKVIHVFFVFSILGTFLEWLAGFAYHMVMGQRLWTYHRFSLTTYTSWLSVPLWGIAGVFFWLLKEFI